MAIKELTFVVCFWIVCGHEFFSSTDQIAQLFEMKKNLLMSLSQCIDAEEKDVEMKSALQNLLLSYSESEDPEKAVRDPVAAYKLLRRLRNELITIIEHFQLSYQCNTYQDDFLEIPQMEDLDGAALGLIRLQEIYKFYPHNISNNTEGLIMGARELTFVLCFWTVCTAGHEFFSSTEMSLSADEAYHVGLAAYNEDKFQHAFLWFLYSLDTLTEYSAITEEELLNVLIFSAYHFGSLPVAIYFNRELLNIDPTNEEVRDQLNILLHSQRTSNPDIFILNTESSNYEALCRGEVDERTSKRQRALSCRYSTGGGNPRLMYAPVKEEVEWDEPRIIRYHDIISDREIEILKNISRPLLSRSKVYEDGQGAISKHRVSQSVFLQDDPVSARVSQRIADATGLSVETAEPLLVQNYGIGGIFEPHYDALETGENDRIATFLIYMSDVEIGGATVFPDVGVAVQPEKVNP
ncbi:hypothetical protein G5714_002226 [Onychostoma macrolepis]|uniref:Prolyl 4-hydroxylase alpha subunit domain-containing protein n=1 Tax=Onychostoma macrolepis TaxID=369639 RepID=A0A7J6DEE1_9TELE|nr:hypothetical protein G5714_002226 [Onychostoma macrolepis]